VAKARNYTRQLNEISEFLKETVQYPSLDGAMPPWRPPAQATTLGSTARVAERAVADALGWRPRPATRGASAQNARAITAALANAFPMVEGVPVWTPRSFTAEAAIGAMTGAQAIVLARAKPQLDTILNILDGLYPLIPNADEENVASIRSLVHDNLDEFVTELGYEEGPRVGRVDEIIVALVGPTSQIANPEQPEGQLGVLQRRFGLLRANVATVSEEENYTNFLILVDYVKSLVEAWNAQKAYFRGNAPDPYLGPLLRDLSEQLAVAGSALVDFENTLDSLFEDEAKRQARRFIVKRKGEITVQEWIDWARDFLFGEGLQLLQDVGKDGVVAFRSNVSSLRRALGAMRGAINRGQLGEAYRTARADLALDQLQQALAETDKLANRTIADPVVDDAYIDVGLAQLQAGRPARAYDLRVEAWGSNFRDDVVMLLVPQIVPGQDQAQVRPRRTVFVDSTRTTAIFPAAQVIAAVTPATTQVVLRVQNPGEGSVDFVVLP
jgi:hypothetical protein